MVKSIVIAVLGLVLQMAFGGLYRVFPELASAAQQAAQQAALRAAASQAEGVAQGPQETPEPQDEDGWESVVVAGPCPTLNLLPNGRLSVCLGWDMESLRAAAAEALGLTEDELDEQLAEHGTLGAVAEAQGVDREALADAIQSAVLAQLETDLNAAVDAGELSRETADRWLERWRDQDFSYLLDSPFFLHLAWPRATFESLPLLPELREGGVPPAGFSFRFELREDGTPFTLEVSSESEAFQRALAEALGISLDELRAGLEAGRSLRKLADEYGLTDEEMSDAIHAATLAAMREQLDAAAAEGRLTQEQADRILEELEDGPRLHIQRWPGLLVEPGEARPFFWFPDEEPSRPLD